MRPALAALCLSSLLPLVTAARADDIPLPTQAPKSIVDPTAWNQKFKVAREALLSGDFAGCAEQMQELAATAPSEAARAIAAEEADLCRTWQAKDLVFVKRSDLGESNIAAKAKNERTSDELAVLYTNAVLYGLGTGAWIDVLTEPKTAAGGVLPALGLAGASALLVVAADSGKPLKYGVPQSVVSGMYIGLYEGITWTIWNQARTRRADEWKDGTVATLIWGSATVGALAGGVIGTTRGTTPGRASYVSSAALWTGLVGSLLGAGLAGKGDTQDDTALLAGAISLNVGAVAGMLTASAVSPSIARVRFIDLGGLAGGLVAGGLYIAAHDHGDGSAGFAITGLGIGTGLAIATWATSGMTPDEGPADTAKKGSFMASVAPTLAPTKGGAMAGVTAIF